MNRADDFNRSDNASSLGGPSDGGSAWSALAGTWGIQTNRAYSSSGGSQEAAVLESGESDGEVEALAPVSPNNWRLVFRATDASNYWMAVATTASVFLYRKEAAADNLVDAWSATWSASTPYRVVLSGTSIEVYHGAALLGSATSSFNQSATLHGVGTHGGSLDRFDDFSFTGSGGGGGGGAVPVFLNHYRQMGFM